MKWLLGAAVLLAVSTQGFGATDGGKPAATTVVAVALGQQKTVPASGFERVVLDDPNLVAVHVRNDKELVVTGLEDGTTRLWVYKKEGNPQAVEVKVGTGVARASGAPAEEDAGVRAVPGRPLQLKPGAEVLFRAPKNQGVAVADPDVAEARLVSDDWVVVHAVAPGTTTAVVYPRNDELPTAYEVTVLGAPPGIDGGL